MNEIYLIPDDNYQFSLKCTNCGMEVPYYAPIRFTSVNNLVQYHHSKCENANVRESNESEECSS